ncbi:MAG: 50S ribosomal protein L19 [Candidatus Gracilibacteria bacterium]|nr:50S ribosomal protein L19 [Candidatus Gracilibacteria bacterium]
MDQALLQISNSSLSINLPEFKVGQTVRVHQRIKEGDKERIQVFEGLIIQVRNGKGVDGTITVRKVVDGIGVERVYPIHSPLLAKIEITKQAKVRRSKLYYMRERSGKSARLKTTQLTDQVFEPKSVAQVEAEKAEAEAAKVAEAEAKKAEEEAAKAAAEAEKAATEEAPAEQAAAPEEKTEESEPTEDAKVEEPAAEEAPAETPKEEEKSEEA